MYDFKSYQTMVSQWNSELKICTTPTSDSEFIFLVLTIFTKGEEDTTGSVEVSGSPQAFSWKTTVLLEALRSRLAMCRGSTLARHWRGRLQAMSQATRLTSSCIFSLDTLSPGVLTCLSNSARSGISFMCGLYHLWFSSENRIIKSEEKALC